MLEAAEALRDHAYDRFGDLMNQSHASLRDLFDVSCDELDTLTSVAHRTNGVLGARMTGGGFGGCTVNLVRAEAVDALATGLREAYLTAYGRTPQVYVLGRNLQTGILDGA